MRNWVLSVLALTLAFSAAAQDFQAECSAGTLWEPYAAVCAEVRDRQHLFLSPPSTTAPTATLSKEGSAAELELGAQSQVEKPDTTFDWPVPGSMAVGTTYEPNQLKALTSGCLHTRMFVHPDGLPTNGYLPVLYTTATSRVYRGLELLAAYRGGGAGSVAQLGLFAWTCLPDFPCPDGDTSAGWQWWADLESLSCNITHSVDPAGHAQKQLYYANHTDKLSEDAPPAWRSAVYLWNYCDSAWDLAWEHTYRVEKIDCSVPGAGCAWWGPSIEIFGDDPYPEIGELGYEESLLFHDGLWSTLRPPEANFRDPAVWARSTPWQLFHLDPNRGYGVGNWFDQNDPPGIDAQALLKTREDESLTVDAGSLVISDPDVDARFHAAYDVTLFTGENYVHSGKVITPAKNFNGTLTVPVTVSDGGSDSEIFALLVDVTPVNDPPVINGQRALATPEQTPLTIRIQDVQVTDPDNEPGDLAIAVQDGAGYRREGNSITPEAGIVGELRAGIVVTDGELGSAVFSLVVLVAADTTPPILILNGLPTVSLRVGDSYVDAGASATDNLEGDVTDRIVTDNPVVTSQAGTYTVTYTVRDLAGNSASSTRTVIVIAPDVTPPVLTLNGPPTVTLQVGDTYVDAGASAVDNVDGNITTRIVTVNPVDTSRAGTYVVTHRVSDTAGNSASISRTVVVSKRPARHNGGGTIEAAVLLLLAAVGALRARAGSRGRPRCARAAWNPKKYATFEGRASRGKMRPCNSRGSPSPSRRRSLTTSSSS